MPNESALQSVQRWRGGDELERVGGIGEAALPRGGGEARKGFAQGRQIQQAERQVERDVL